MNRSTTIRRLFGKFALWVLVTLVAVVGLWVALNRFLDESPHNNRVATLETRQARIPESQNIAVGVIGLLAPRGSDFIQHGSMLKAMYESNTPYRQILEAMNGASSLQPTIESHDLYCWLDGTGLDPASCIPFDEAPEILQQNAELLRRFRSLQSLESYSNLFALTNSEIITIARLNLADIRLDLENGKSEEAFQKWKGQLRMTRAMLRGADTWIGKAISLVVFGLTYPSLEEILIRPVAAA